MEKISKPGEYRYTQGQWKRYNPPRTLKAEQKKIEIEQWQKKNKLLWRRMEGMSKETQEEIERKRVPQSNRQNTQSTKTKRNRTRNKQTTNGRNTQ